MNRRWCCFGLFSIAWTVLLVMPGTVQEELPLGEFLRSWRALIAKFAHVGGYAGLTFLAGRLSVAMAGRLVLLFLLMLHAAGTEFIQLHVAQRNGALSDVLFNHGGIALGLLASWRWWTAPPPT